jgi:hypothetical protein
MICLSKTSFATISGLADFVCQTETDRSSAPNATTEHMFEVATGADRFRKKMWGLYDCDNSARATTKRKRPHTATSTVFSCPTRLISDVQLLRAITAAIKTKPLLLVAFEAVICAPSGDQLCRMNEDDEAPKQQKSGTTSVSERTYSRASPQMAYALLPQVANLSCAIS